MTELTFSISRRGTLSELFFLMEAPLDESIKSCIRRSKDGEGIEAEIERILKGRFVHKALFTKLTMIYTMLLVDEGTVHLAKIRFTGRNRRRCRCSSKFKWWTIIFRMLLRLEHEKFGSSFNIVLIWLKSASVHHDFAGDTYLLSQENESF